MIIIADTDTIMSGHAHSTLPENITEAKRMEHGFVLINLSGRGDKDMDYTIENHGIR